jgi:predicted transcriptional regulator
MKRNPQDITDAELAVMRILWERGPQTAGDVTELLYPACTPSDIGTVHSLLQRLERKKLVARDRGLRPHLFAATVTRETIAGRQLKSLARRITGGALAPFLTHLVESDQLSQDELDEIRKLINRKAASRKNRKQE